ncbi:MULTISPECIES: hypothetical protein [Bacillus cereus group]|uniref:hypothetical protein n=1 Tax=Bacillus cereus group TaxID=86661 RepID=UPI00077299E7|nr:MULTISPECIES: hypothetical protein [Bacillus cereus group]KXI54752.1 hypothetical protein ACS95_04625 [Bacillus cereus]MDA2770327.1 hypothetical protein [Bacillus cereus group sp. Bc010]MED1448304.1 hypothetical protein [Bacillus pacificus]
MDVKYRPEPWQNMGDGMNRITKDALIKLQRANELLKKIDGRIRDLDSDGSIHFNPKDQSQKIGELLDSYSTLQRYCGEVGRLVSEHIDKPFLVEMDKFAQKMRDTSILSFETDNRIGSTTTTVLPDAHAGYGSVPQTIKTKKDKITVEDIFRDSPAFDNVLREEYKELKKQNPDAKLNYEEYKKVVPSTRGFEYKSIEDEQKKLEMVRDIGIGVGIIITTILCPPLGTAAAVVYGAVQIKSGIDGEDSGTHRKLSQEERVGNIIFGGLDAIPVVGAVAKGVKAFKDTSELADLAKLLKFKEGMPGFNPNLGGNVVQSLKENKNLKNALDAMKNTPIPVAVRTVDTGIGMKLPYIESSTVGEVAGKFSKASTTAKDDAYQLAKGTGEGGKGNSDLLDNTGRFKDAELQSKYDVYCERKYKNSEAPKEPLEWKEASEKWASLKEQGQEFSDESFNLFSQQYENAEREITIVTHEGTKVRVDAIASDEYGNVIIQEYKSSATAPYTTNQEKGFPELKNSGGKVVGEGKGDFSGGYEVPSGTRPQIVRPEGTTYFDE